MSPSLRAGTVSPGGIGLFQLAVAAAVKNQGQLFLTVEGFDQTDKDQVVTSGVAHLVAAFEPGAAAGQYRCAACSDAEFDVIQIIASRLRKALRKIDLVGGKHVDRIVAARLENRQRRGMPAEAP